MKLSGISVALIFALLAVASVLAQDAPPAADKPAAVPAAVPVAAPAAAPALEPKAPVMPPLQELRKTGTVSVTKDASGKVSAIKLIVVHYDIILDEGSKALESLDGQRVRVIGTFSMPEGKRSFTVKSVEPVTDEMKAPGAPAAPAPAKPAEAAPEK